MSRLAKKPIAIRNGVTVTKNADTITVKGPKGELVRTFKPIIEIVVDDKEIALTPKNNDSFTRSLWGTYASHLINMMEGVTQGYSKKLEISGVGFKVALVGDRLEADLHLLIALRRDREHPQLHHAVAHVFEQAGVLGAAHDFGVDRVGVLGVEEVPPLLFPIDPHGELVHARALGHREEIGGFEVAVGVVAEGLFDGGDTHLLVDADGDLVVHHCLLYTSDAADE